MTAKTEDYKKADLQHLPNSIKEPSMRIDLLLILSFNNEDDLDRDKVEGFSFLRKDKFGRCINRQLSGVL